MLIFLNNFYFIIYFRLKNTIFKSLTDAMRENEIKKLDPGQVYSGEAKTS